MGRYVTMILLLGITWYVILESFDQKIFLLSSWDAQNHLKLESILTTEANP